MTWQTDGSAYPLVSPPQISAPGARTKAVALRDSAVASSGAQTLAPRRLPAEMEKMITVIDERVAHSSKAEEARVRMLADHSQRLHEGLQALRVAREINEERRVKELRMIESNVMLDLGHARQARVKLEEKVEEASNERLAAHRDDLLRSRQQHEQMHQDYAREIGDEVKRLTSVLTEQKASRVEYGERIVSSLEGEFQKVHDGIVGEQKLRYETEGTMLRMMEDVCSQMRGEIQQERSERESVQSKLLSLLEDTCNRIEGTFSVSPSGCTPATTYGPTPSGASGYSPMTPFA